MQRVEPNSANLQVAPARSDSICSSVGKVARTVGEACKVIWIIIKQWFSFSPYEIRELDLDRISPEMQQKLKDFERNFDYPLGDGKRFRILHGKGQGDYFGFVRRLGNPKFYVAINKKDREVTRQVTVDGRPVEKKVVLKAGEIAGVGCGVLREMNQPGNAKPLKAWYICDLKVKEEYRGETHPYSIVSERLLALFSMLKRICDLHESRGRKRP